MKIIDSETGKLFFQGKDWTSILDGSPAIHKDTAIPLAQQIHDMLIGRGFTYMQCWLILHLVITTLRQERDTKAL